MRITVREVRVSPSSDLPRSDSQRGDSERSDSQHRTAPSIQAQRWLLQGRVQGLGVRPAIARLATELELGGAVSNTPEGVSIRVEGSDSALDAFAQRLPDALPPTAHVGHWITAACQPTGEPGFRIEDSCREGPLATIVPTDLAVCTHCLAELADPTDRRHAYPFISCTACGPRYTLIDSLPYDRGRTAMASFEVCNRCDREYSSPSDRRFHSQINACPDCGPSVWLSDGDGSTIARHAAAIRAAASALRSGGLIALRGVGGYQWLVDATDEAAVSRLRRCKGRPEKPFAVMVVDIAAAAKLALCDRWQAERLSSPANPILVLPRRADADLAATVSGTLDTIGVMLPSTPLHALLARACDRPLVVTSGNVEGDPIPYLRPSSKAPDSCLEHDRDILRPIDDSVVRTIAGRDVSLRLGRGMAPLPLALPPEMLQIAGTDGAILAVGGHQKSAVALFNGTQAVLGPHFGDLATLSMRERFVEQVTALCELYRASPRQLVHDSHPDYFSTRWALERGLPTVAVQHHHAHIVAGMIQPGWLDRSVLGVAWDGTGYGDDGSVWGGEFLIADAIGYRRVAHLRPFRLVGGDAAIRQPWRVAVSLVHQGLGAEAAARLRFPEVPTEHVEQLVNWLQRPMGSTAALDVWTTSAGRLCDGVAALVLGTTENRHDGQAAMLWEATGSVAEIAEADQPRESYELPLIAGSTWQLDWRPMMSAVNDDVIAGHEAATISTRFHQALGLAIWRVAQRFSELPVVLGGGCFQNRLLVEAVTTATEWPVGRLATPGSIPPGDGGLAAGQLAVAIARRHHQRTA
jgi:hydrogenase maturation protein HypF